MDFLIIHATCYTIDESVLMTIEVNTKIPKLLERDTSRPRRQHRFFSDSRRTLVGIVLRMH